MNSSQKWIKLIDKATLSLIISLLAIIVATWSGYTQYQQRQDAIEEKLKIELKMTLDGSPLSPSDLRVLSGVDERENLKTAMLITNIGNSTVRITEAGYQDYDMPEYASFSGSKDTLSSGEQVLLPIENIITLKQQLTNNINTGEDEKAKIFAVTTKGKRFETPAIIEVAE